MTRRASIIVLLAVLAASAPAYAQIDLSGAGASDLNITVSPQSPTPGSTISLSLESALLDLTDSSIAWYENGSVIAAGTGMTSASFIAGPLGKESAVVVDVQAPDGTQDSAQAVIIPTQIDLLVDSDSYVPPFYRGRALPSAGTDIRLEAIARFKRADGSLVPSSDIIYTWKQDDRVVGSVSGRGKSSVILPAATLYGTSDIEVDAISADGALSGTASVAIPSSDPVVLLYEDNPLWGLTYYHALAAESAISDVEMTFAAIPYFALIQSPNDPRLAYAWTVNGSALPPSESDPSEITLNAENSTGQATVGLELTHATDIFMDSRGQWDIDLAASGSNGSGETGGGVKNPFTGQ